MEPYSFEDLRPISEMDADALEGEIAFVNADENHPYHHKEHAQHKLARARMDEIYARLHPDQEQRDASFAVSLANAGVSQESLAKDAQTLDDLKSGKSVMQKNQDGKYIIVPTKEGDTDD